MRAVTTASLPRIRHSLLGRLSSAAGPRARSLAGRAAAGLREHMGSLAGLAAITAGAWAEAWQAGLIVAGVSCLLLEFKVKG